MNKIILSPRGLSTGTIILLLILTLLSSDSYAKVNNVRVGLSLGGINWGGQTIALNYDHLGFLPQRNASIGGELDLLNGGFILSPRILFWQKKSVSGFHGGPSASFGVMKEGTYSHSYAHNYNNFLVGIGGECGWLYRFPARIDVGGGLDLKFTNYGIWLGFKLNIGYLVH